MHDVHVSNEPDIDTMDIRELRKLLKCLQAQYAQLDKEKSEAELNLLAQNTNSFSPFAANLTAPINATAQMDAQQVMTQVTSLCLTWKQDFCPKWRKDF